MDSRSRHRRARKIRRTGRHTTPSQVEKVAEVAGKAAPAMAIAGVLVASSPAHAATVANATTVSEQAHTDAVVRHHHQAQSRTYAVRPGDTLSAIAQRFYGNTADWTWIYNDNRSVIQNPNDIYAGEMLKIPSGSTSTATTATALRTRPSTSRPPC